MPQGTSLSIMRTPPSPSDRKLVALSDLESSPSPIARVLALSPFFARPATPVPAPRRARDALSNFVRFFRCWAGRDGVCKASVVSRCDLGVDADFSRVFGISSSRRDRADARRRIRAATPATPAWPGVNECMLLAAFLAFVSSDWAVCCGSRGRGICGYVQSHYC